MAPCLFQSLLDFALSILLLLTTWTMAEPGVDEGSRAEGVLGWMECHLWKTEFLLWGLNVSSTWNIVTLTIERCVTACKRSLRRLCSYTCLSVILFTGEVWPIACWDTPPGPEAGIPHTPRTRGKYPRSAVHAGRYRQ